MSPDDYQRAWQTESDQTRVHVDIDSLRHAVESSQRDFRSLILVRDLREAGLSFLMIPIWFYLGDRYALPWTWYLTVPALLWVGGFLVVDRMRHKRNSGEPGESLLECARETLAQLDHQIWLLRNVFWWYLLPFVLSITAFFAQVSWESSERWLTALGTTMVMVSFVVVLYSFVYYINQLAVRKQLEPRRQEFLMLIAGLSEESSGEVRGEFPILMSGQSVSAACYKPSSRQFLWAVVGAVVFLSIGAGGIFIARDIDDSYPKKSPFSAVQWQDSQPQVQVDEEWFALVSLNEISASEIIEFSQRTFGDMWRKRFEEDLVELLSRMGHPPADSVTLVVESPVTSERRTFENVAMTQANRRAIRDAAQAREARETEEGELDLLQSTETDSVSEPHEDKGFAQRLEEIRATYKLPAMAAFTLRDGAIVDRATVGARSTKDTTPVGPDAQWHLGSNTKGMTATVAGMLVEEGLLQWESTIGEILGEGVPNMDVGHRDTTLAMLFQHRSGIAANISWYTAPEDRVACAAKILAAGPKERGHYAYSNAGYVVAGAMMEVVTGKRWEDLMQERLFAPLGMTNTSFGAPSKPGAPWGHRKGFFGWKPMNPMTRGSDNALVLGPAGTVHATLEDYAKFVAAHLAGARGEGGIVSAETFATLHTPPDGGDYAMGWSVTERGWAGGRALSHSGSNTMWFATVWIAPEKNQAYFAVTNVGGVKAFEGVDAAIEALIDRQGD